MDSRKVLLWAAILSVLALLTHTLDASDHLKEWWGYGSIFVMTAVFQFFYGLALFIQPWKYDEEGNLRRSAIKSGRSYYLLGFCLTAFALVAYVVSRTSGLPFLAREATVAPVTALSLVAPIVNLPLLALLFILIRRSSDPSAENA